MKHLLLLSGCIVVNLYAMNVQEKVVSTLPQDEKEIVVRFKWSGRHKQITLPVDPEATIKVVREELMDRIGKDTLPSLYAVWKTWWPKWYGWQPGWAIKRSENLDDNLMLHEVMKRYNTSTFEVLYF